MAAALARLAGPSNLPTTAATAYTGVGNGAVLREIRWVNTTAAAITVQLSVGALGNTTLIWKGAIPANSTYSEPASVPIAAATTLQWVADLTGLTGTLSGATL